MVDAAVSPGHPPAAVTGTMVGRYMLGRVVGKGLSSEVRLATDMDNDRLVALKILRKEWIWKNDMSALVRREIEIMKELDHPSVVKLIEVFNSDTHVFMAMEAVDGQELYAEINRKGMLEEHRARDLFHQLIVAVDYIHSLGIAHRDLKLENLLLSKDGKRIKVTDFGLAARLDEWEGDPKHQKWRSWGTKRNQRRQQTACGTPSYAAPEIIASAEIRGYDARGVDIWCAGVVLYAMVTGKMPFRGENVNATLDIIRAKEPAYPKQLSPEITDLLRSMLQKDPSKRMSVAGVLAHPWTTLPPQQPPSSEKLESLLGASASPQEAPSTEQDLAAAARDAIETAKRAASAAERAAVAAREAETTAAAALAAAADAAGSRSSSPAHARGAKGESIRGIGGGSGGGGGGDARPLSSPRSGLIPEWGQKITRLFGRQSSTGRGTGVKNAKEVEADRAAATARFLPSVAASRRALLTHSASTVGPRVRAWSGEASHDDHVKEGPGESRSASMSASLAGRQFAPSHTYGLDEVGHRRGGVHHFPAGGIFATTKASVGSATVAARRKLLRRSSSAAASSDKLAASMLHSNCTLVTPVGVVCAATAPSGRGSGESKGKASPGGGGGANSSVRARAHRNSVNFSLLSSMVKDCRDGEGERSHEGSVRPTIEHSLPSAFAATPTACDTVGADATLKDDGSVPTTLMVAAMVTATSPSPSSAGGTDSSPREQGVASLSEGVVAFDVVASPASMDSTAAAVAPPAVEVTNVDESLKKSAPTTAEQSIPPSLSTATTISAPPSLEDAAPIAASDHHEARTQQEGQDRPPTPVTLAVALEDALPPDGLELPKPSKAPCSSSGENSAKPLAELSADYSVVPSAKTPAETSARHGSSESASQAAEASSELPTAGLWANTSAEALKGHAPEPSVDRSSEAVTTNLSMASVVKPAVESSAESVPGPEGRLLVEKPTGLPTEVSTELPAELSAQSWSPTREVEILDEGRTPEAVEKREGKAADADATTAAVATPTDAVAVEASTETPVEEQPVEKPRTVTATAVTATVTAATAVGVVAAAADSAVAAATVAITSPDKHKTAEVATETVAEPPAAEPAAANPLVEQSAVASSKAPSRSKRAIASQLPSHEEAKSESEEKIAKNLGTAASAATGGAAMSSPGPDDTITAAMGFSSTVPTLVLKCSVSDKQREVSPGRKTPQGRAPSLRGRPLPSRSTTSLRVSPRGLSPRGRGRSLSPKSKSKAMMKSQSQSQEGSSRARSMSRSLEASSPLRSMAQSDEAASPSPRPAAAAGDDRTTAAEAEVVVVVTGVTAAAGAEATATTKEDAKKNSGKDACRWSSGAGGGMEDRSGKTETVVSSDSSTTNNLRERVGGEENIWVAAVDNGDAVRHRASGRYRRGVQHRRCAGGGEAAPRDQAPVPSSGPTAEASGGVIAAAVAARSRVGAAAAANAAAAVPASAGRDPPVVTIEAKKARKKGKSIRRTVARIFGRRERTVTVARGGGVG